jgi:hypothetical protein
MWDDQNVDSPATSLSARLKVNPTPSSNVPTTVQLFVR